MDVTVLLGLALSTNQSINQSIMDVAANSTISHFLHSFVILFYKFGTVNTYLTLPLFIEVFVPNLKRIRHVFVYYHFSIEFWNCFQNVVFLVFHLIKNESRRTQSSKETLQLDHRNCLPFRSTWDHQCFCRVFVAQSLVLYVVFCRSLFVSLYLFSLSVLPTYDNWLTFGNFKLFFLCKIVLSEIMSKAHPRWLLIAANGVVEQSLVIFIFNLR